MRRTLRRWRTALVFSALAGTLVLGLPACASASGASKPPGATANRFTIVGSEFRFEPATLTVPRGTQVQLVFENRGGIEHDIHVRGLRIAAPDAHGATGHSHAKQAGHEVAPDEIHLSAQPARQDSATFTAETIGTFGFECTFPGHRDAGMKGQLTVR
ncbi:MAG: cupredoxin domain-containing protein [Chloroflexi bacterium]|nr:cupredoxin domain-containing protein [Chloroflexota bacterium]